MKANREITMCLQCKWDSLKKLSPQKLAARVPHWAKPIMPPKPYQPERSFPVRYTVHPWTVAKTIAVDAHEPAFPKHYSERPFYMRSSDGKTFTAITDPKEYVRAFDIAKNLKPATAWIKPTHGSFA